MFFFFFAVGVISDGGEMSRVEDEKVELKENSGKEVRMSDFENEGRKF